MRNVADLAPTDEVARAELVIVGRVASHGDFGRGQLLDVGLERRVVVVDEPVHPAVVGEIERPHQEGSHLAASHGSPRGSIHRWQEGCTQG